MRRPTSSRWSIVAFVAMVVLGTAVIVVTIGAATGSWASGAVVGGMAGGLSVAGYPLFFRRR